MAELNLPPIRFAEVGRPNLYLWAVRPALFAGVLEVGPASGGEPFDTGSGQLDSGLPTGRAQTLETAGGQLDFNFTAAFRLPMTFSVGYASGFEPDGRQRSELMASLKILGSRNFRNRGDRRRWS